MRTKKVKPPPKKYDYTLIISGKTDNVLKKDYISFKFQTTKEFLTFKYILNIETEVMDKKILFDIIGFEAPAGDLSNPGYAEYEYKFFDFQSGDYSVQVGRTDNDKSKFNLKIGTSGSNSIKAAGVPRNSFIDILVQNDT